MRGAVGQGVCVEGGVVKDFQKTSEIWATGYLFALRNL